MTDNYKKCVRYFINSYMRQGYNINITTVPDYIIADDAYKVMTTLSDHGSNFEQANVDDIPEKIMVNLFYSIKNLRKNTV